MNNSSLSIVIPAYNEESSIAPLIDDLHDFLKKKPIVYEIIVIDDGSTDQTRQIIENKKIICLHHDCNQGYGLSIKRGVQKAQHDLIAIIDADGTYEVTALDGLLNAMQTHDMAVGARIGRTVHIPIIRKPAKWFINALANYLTNQKIPDLNSGLRIFKKSIFNKYIQILPNGFSLTTTITLAFLTNGHTIKYIPIDYLKRAGMSKIRPVRDTIHFIQLIIRTILYFDPLKIFFPLSFLCFLASLIVLVVSYKFTERVMDTTTIILFVTSIQLLAIGLLADLIDKRSRL